MIPDWKIYPRSQGHSTVYLKNVVKDPTIRVGEYTTYDDYVNDPRDFERNCVLYHYPECNGDTLTIGKFCSIACGAKFIFNAPRAAAVLFQEIRFETAPQLSLYGGGR